MKIGLCQVNPIVGDLEGNVQRCLDAIQTAQNQQADLIVLPEMAIPGCHPRDILFDPSFISAIGKASDDLAWQARHAPPVLVGSITSAKQPLPDHPNLYNAALWLENGKSHMVAARRVLRTDDVFFEPRWFLSGPLLPPISIAGETIGILLGEDFQDKGYDTHPVAELKAGGAQCLICLSAIPYQRQSLVKRLEQAGRHLCSLVCVNLCGANDELIFDGQSFITLASGQPALVLPAFEETVQVFDLQGNHPISIPDMDAEEELFTALTLGVKDFMRKNQVNHAFLGLSGGVDSAVVACIAAAALGAENVTAVAIPGRYTDPRSTRYAEELAHTLGIQFEVLNMETLHQAAESLLSDLLSRGTSAENIQARMRTMILMAYVNHHGGLLLNTSNKTELSLGYGTLYGDLAGALCPIADLTKPEVYRLAHWLNRNQPIIPKFILERPPSAELRPDQIDPFDYDTISPQINALILENRSNAILRQTEHKRKQFGIILKVSEKSFGIGRLIPVTRR